MHWGISRKGHRIRTAHKTKPKFTHQTFKENRDIVRSGKSRADPGKDLKELLGFSALRVTKGKEKKPLRGRRADAMDYLDMVLQLGFISLVFGDADDIGRTKTARPDVHPSAGLAFPR